jgi:hypothetical protein
MGYTISKSARERALSDLLDYAFGELLWVSEAPNRDPNLQNPTALALAVRAREAVIYIEVNDPDKM